MTTTQLHYHGHPVELIELAATIHVPYVGLRRAKRQASSNGYNGAPGYALIRSACPKPCCADRGARVVRYDTLTVVTA